MKFMIRPLQISRDLGKSARGPRLALLLAAAALLLGGSASWAQGTASFNYPIHWIGMVDLYFYVSGGPANTCGDAVVTRNGVTSTTVGWLCTDASGNATKGPWSWANQPNDETSSSYIRWPGGGTTNTANHIWDKTAPTASITSPGGTPPTSFYGNANDAAWGAGFNASWTVARTTFHDLDTDLYWTPALGAYSGARRCRPVGGGCDVPQVNITLSGMPTFSATWSSPVPPAGVHTSGHSYDWQICVFDGGQWGCSTLSFTAP